MPCKHTLGLLLLLAEGAVPVGSRPERVTQWLAGDRAKTRGDRRKAPADPEGIARRAASRDAKVSAGAAELDRWLADLVRSGLGAAQSRSWSWWDEQARRMIDAQARGLAGQVRRMAGIAATAGHRADWPDRLTDLVGSVHLLCSAWPRRDALAQPTRDALRVRLGYAVPAEEVAERGERISDTWSVLGERTSDDGNLRSLQQWLYGERSGQVVSFLSFGAGGQPPPDGLPPGRRTEATVALYPGTQAPRALIIGSEDGSRPLGLLPVAGGWDTALERAAGWLSADPWADVLPLAAGGLCVLPGDTSGEPWLLRDSAGLAMPLAGSDHIRWALLALSGGGLVDVAGEWDGFGFMPQAAAEAGQPAQLLTGWRTGWPDISIGAGGTGGPASAGNGWPELVHAAVLGTGRAPVAVPNLLAEAGLDGRAEDDLMLLNAAALMSRARRAGFRPANAAARSAPEPAGPDPRAAVSQTARERLAALLVAGERELAAEWQRNLGGRRPPDALLPALLTAAGQDLTLRDSLRPVLGPRARWLAAFSPAWSWLADAEAMPADVMTAWQTGTADRRRELLAALRATDPAAGRKLVASTWDSDPYRDRAAFTALLAVGLSADDEPLAQRALADRRAEVRRAGADLLTRLPDSAYSRRAAARAAATVQVSRGPVRTTLIVKPPGDLTREEADAEPSHGAAPTDWRLREVVAAAPASFWTDHAGLEPAQLLALTERSEWQGPLRAGWSAAAIRDRDVGWLTALLDEPGSHRNVTDELALFSALPESAQDHWLRTHPGSPLFVAALAKLAPPWSEPLSDVVRAVLADLARANPGRSAAPRTLLRLASLRLEPPVPPVVPVSEVHDKLAVSWTGLETALSERAAMRRELAEEQPP